MPLHRIALVGIFLAGTAASAFAQADRFIDDFTTGHYQSPTLFSGGNDDNIQKGTMMGATRETFMQVCEVEFCGGLDSFNTAASYGIFAKTPERGAGFVQSAGYGNPPSTFLLYGQGERMNENFSAYDRIRVNFYGLTQPIAFSVSLASMHPDAYAEAGCTVPASGKPFSIELPLDKLSASGGFDLAHIADAGFFFQSGTPGGASFAIASIQLSDHALPGALACASRP